MGLEDYIRKRKFDNTPEPEGELGREDARRFVIQRHQARRLALRFAVGNARGPEKLGRTKRSFDEPIR